LPGAGVACRWLASLQGYANSGRFSPLLFSERGIAPIGYALFGVAAGAAAGLVLRRTVPAMAVALAGLAGARLAVTGWVRPRLIPPAHLALPIMPFTRSILFDFGSGTGPAPLNVPGRASTTAALPAAVQHAANHSSHYWASVGRLPDVPGDARELGGR
jgi:hypothetical protein